MKTLIKAKTVVSLFDISIPTLYRWIKAGKLPKPVVMNNRRYWMAEQVEEAQEKLLGSDEVAVNPSDLHIQRVNHES